MVFLWSLSGSRSGIDTNSFWNFLLLCTNSQIGRDCQLPGEAAWAPVSISHSTALKKKQRRPSQRMKYVRQHLHKIYSVSFFRLNSQIRCTAFTDSYLSIFGSCRFESFVICFILITGDKHNNFRKYMVMAHVQIKDALTEALSIYCIFQMGKIASLEESDYWWLNTENIAIWQWSLSFTVFMDRQQEGHSAFGFKQGLGKTPLPATFSHEKVEK